MASYREKRMAIFVDHAVGTPTKNNDWHGAASSIWKDANKLCIQRSTGPSDVADQLNLQILGATSLRHPSRPWSSLNTPVGIAFCIF